MQRQKTKLKALALPPRVLVVDLDVSWTSSLVASEMVLLFWVIVVLTQLRPSRLGVTA